MSRKAIFCESYGVIKSALYFSTHNQDTSSSTTIIIPGNPDLYKLFKVINEKVFGDEFDLIFLEPYHGGREKVEGIRKLIHILPDVVKERRYLKKSFDKYFSEFADREIFFSSRYFNGPLFYQLRKLSKRNKLVYVDTFPPYRTPSQEYLPADFNEIARLIVAKLTYGLDMAMCKFSTAEGILFIPDRFMAKAVDKFIDWGKMKESMNGFDLNRFKLFDAGNYSVMFFNQDLVGKGCFKNHDVYWRELSDIFTILTKYFHANEIGIKLRPNFRSDSFKIKVGVILPSYIPAEFLYGENIKLYLGITSTAIANIDNGLSVSILDLLSFKSDKVREKFKATLKQVSQSEVLFPKSLDDFEKILAGIAS